MPGASSAWQEFWARRGAHPGSEKSRRGVPIQGRDLRAAGAFGAAVDATRLPASGTLDGLQEARGIHGALLSATFLEVGRQEEVLFVGAQAIGGVEEQAPEVVGGTSEGEGAAAAARVEEVQLAGVGALGHDDVAQEQVPMNPAKGMEPRDLPGEFGDPGAAHLVARGGEGGVQGQAFGEGCGPKDLGPGPAPALEESGGDGARGQEEVAAEVVEEAQFALDVEAAAEAMGEALANAGLAAQGRVLDEAFEATDPGLLDGTAIPFEGLGEFVQSRLEFGAIGAEQHHAAPFDGVLEPMELHAFGPGSMRRARTKACIEKKRMECT